MFYEYLKKLKNTDDIQEIINILDNLEDFLLDNNINYDKVIEELIRNKNVSHMIYILSGNMDKLSDVSDFILMLVDAYNNKLGEDDIELLEMLKRKSLEDEELIVKRYQRLVYKYANMYRGRGVEFEDLVQVGNMGLLKAIREYDYTRKSKFMSVAVWYIKGFIRRELYNNSRSVRIPIYVKELIDKIYSLKSKYYKEYKSEITDEEICDIFNISLEKLHELYSYSLSIDSLDRQIENDKSSKGVNLSNFIPDNRLGPEEESEKRLLVDGIQRLFRLARLSERQIQVLTFRYGLGNSMPITLEEIGKKFGLTRERVRQIEESAKKKIKESTYAKEFKIYIDGQCLDEVKNMDEDSSIEKKQFKEGDNDKMNTPKKMLSGFKGITIDQLRDAVSQLNEKDQNIVYKRYGRTLEEILDGWTSNEAKRYRNKIKVELMRILGIEHEEVNAKKIFKRVDCYDVSIIKCAIEGMFQEYKDIIYKKFGSDLDGYYTITNEEAKLLNALIIPTIKRRIKKIIKGEKVLPMKKYNRNESGKMVKDSNIQVIEEVTQNVEENNSIETDEIKDTANISETSTNDLSPESNNSAIESDLFDCSHLEPIVSSPMFKEFIKRYDVRDMTICALAFGYIGKYYDIDSLSLFLNIDKNIIIKGIKKVIAGYKMYINEELDNAIEKPIEKRLQLL